jgi:hypothetical protein
VTYVVYPDEGHGFLRPESRISFNSISEAFFATHLGGRWEPFGKDLHGSSLEVREGVGEIAELRECLDRQRLKRVPIVLNQNIKARHRRACAGDLNHQARSQVVTMAGTSPAMTGEKRFT